MCDIIGFLDDITKSKLWESKTVLSTRYFLYPKYEASKTFKIYLPC